MKKIIAGGGLVVNEQQEILMIFRRGYWDLPKGKLDGNETIEDCSVREVMEETGLKQVLLDKFICKTYHEYFDKWVNEDVIKETWWYLMNADSNELLIPQTEEDIEKIEWVSIENLTEYKTKMYASIIDVLEKWAES